MKRGRKPRRYEITDPATGEDVAGTALELARRLGISRNAVYCRIRALGIRPEAPPRRSGAPGPSPSRAKRAPAEYEIRDPETGETLRGTLAELAARTGARPGTARWRMSHRGMTPEEALTVPKRVPAVREIRDPETGETLRGTRMELLERSAVAAGTVRWRMARGGMTFEEAVTAPKRSRRVYEVRDPESGEIAEGTIRELSERFGIPEGTVRSRLRRGMGIQEALTAPKGIYPGLEAVDPATGEAVTGSIRTLSARFGTSFGRVQRRLAAGMPLQEALAAPRLRGVEYEVVDPETGARVRGMIKDLCVRFGAKESTVRRRLSGGMGIQEALSRPPHARRG